MRKLLPATLLLLATAPFASQAAEECGKVTIADMNWNSASLIANVDMFILKNGFGCDAELIPGDTMPTGTSMIEKGEPDIAPELWSNSLKAALDRGVEEGRLRFAAPVFAEGGEEGFWVPKYMVDKDPSLATIKGVLKNASLFTHPEDPDKSAFYGCPAGWNCQISSGNLFNAMKFGDAGFELIDPGSSAGLTGSIASAYEKKEPWFGYYWAPTAVLGKYEMVKVDFGSGVDAEHFKACITNAECENPKATMYPPSAVDTIITESFAKRSPAAVEYLSKRSFSNAQMNLLLAWMEENQADGEIAMEHFMKNYSDTWMQWVGSDIAKKVKNAL
ncbi:ABC transporter substrate-binding protein [Veronia nyctiphanis]|uniref:ABC transporter substrate-binding protein n=1 Tax=Veronia nyctiphanis TaxID=1278244 RepID=A0A4Q0YK98_9GAMM|nr:ABC transporter substrate-binding protein [Veronia nyctiphanis]RXJ70384.1 ABC transporter substrate-binding protein [Veronia nyctiphanis]